MEVDISVRKDEKNSKVKIEPVNIRTEMANYISDSASRILEIGPLKRCLLDRSKYSNYYFADIRSTEEIKVLYGGNRYLEKTGISIDVDDIISIDYVIKKSYTDTFKNIKKFDYIIVSHVLEHIPNLIGFFLDIQNILKKEGEIIIIYPDKRFSFDFFRSDTKFSDVYNVYKGNSSSLAGQVLDFYTNVIQENNAEKFWNMSNEIQLPEKKDIDKNLDSYSNTLRGIIEEDVHYWPFSDSAFIKFLFDCSIYDLLPFTIKKFIPTQFNTQSFLVVLKKGDAQELEVYKKYIDEAKEYFEKEYYTGGKEINYHKEKGFSQELGERKAGDDISITSSSTIIAKTKSFLQHTKDKLEFWKK